MLWSLWLDISCQLEFTRKEFKMLLHLGFVLLVAASCFAAARADYEDLAGAVFSDRVPRSIMQGSFPRPGSSWPPQPSPTFPRPPRPDRFRREAEVDDEPSARYVRDVERPPPRFPQPPSPTIPRPGDIGRPALPRFKRSGGGGGRVSVDVDKSRGSKPSARVSVEQNLYKGNNGRTRLDASGYATTRGDRGGMINFSHRFR